MKKPKFIKVALTLLLGISALAATHNMGYADDTVTDTTTKITINKLIWNDQAPADFQNTGETMTFDGSATPLNGSEFTVYDVSSKYYEYISGSDQKTALSKIQTDAAQGAPTYATVVTSKVTAGAGQAVFDNLPMKTTDGKYKVYLFLETKTPDNITVTKLSAPLVIALPIYKLDANQKPTDMLNTNIQLYPKNVTSKDTKEFVNVGSFSQVTIGDQTFANVSTGDTLNYALTVNIPANIGNPTAVTSYKVSDTPTTGLALVNGTVVVAGLTAGTDYNITYANGGFTIDFVLTSAKVKALAGQKMKITYDMKLTAEVDPNSLESNKAQIKPMFKLTMALIKKSHLQHPLVQADTSLLKKMQVLVKHLRVLNL